MASLSFPAIRDRAWGALVDGDMAALEEALFLDEDVAPASALASGLIMEAIKSENWDGARRLIEVGAEVNGYDTKGRNALHHCARARDNEQAALLTAELLREGIQVNHRDGMGIMPWADAVETGKLEMVDLLLENGAIIGDGGAELFSLLARAVTCPAPAEMLELLARHGILLTVRSLAGATVLHIASGAAIPEAVKHLLDQGMDASAIDAANLQPLHWLGRNLSEDLSQTVAAANLAATVALLIRNGANLDAYGPEGKTPLHKAVDWERAPLIIDALLDAGASIDAANESGETPLHVAASLRCQDSAEKLVARGAGLDLEDCNGSRPEDRAGRGGACPLSDFLQSARQLRELEKTVGSAQAPGRRRMQ